MKQQYPDLDRPVEFGLECNLKPAWSPLAADYDSSDQAQRDAWWRDGSIREHVASYFLSAGQETRYHPKRVKKSSEAAYNSLKEIASLLWIAEVFCVPRNVLQSAVSAMEKERCLASKARVFRSFVPWAVVRTAAYSFGGRND